jgi:hypothetical protein
MFKFSIPIEQGEDPNTDLAAFGFVHDHVFVVHPFVSACSRFAVDPTKHYGISRADADELVRLNKLLDTATQAALNAGCKAVQDEMGITSGDAAGVFFSGDENVRAFSKGMADYIQFELVQAGAEVTP